MPKMADLSDPSGLLEVLEPGVQAELAVQFIDLITGEVCAPLTFYFVPDCGKATHTYLTLRSIACKRY